MTQTAPLVAALMGGTPGQKARTTDAESPPKGEGFAAIWAKEQPDAKPGDTPPEEEAAPLGSDESAPGDDGEAVDALHVTPGQSVPEQSFAVDEGAVTPVPTTPHQAIEAAEVTPIPAVPAPVADHKPTVQVAEMGVEKIATKHPLPSPDVRHVQVQPEPKVDANLPASFVTAQQPISATAMQTGQAVSAGMLWQSTGQANLPRNPVIEAEQAKPAQAVLMQSSVLPAQSPIDRAMANPVSDMIAAAPVVAGESMKETRAAKPKVDLSAPIARAPETNVSPANTPSFITAPRPDQVVTPLVWNAQAGDRAQAGQDAPLTVDKADVAAPERVLTVGQTTTGAHSQGTTSAAMLSAAGQARPIAGQLAATATALKNGSTEIALSPEELGKVRMTLTPSETGMIMVITAERPETADLMRRNIDVLAQEFRDMGMEDVAFSFDQPGDDPQTDQQHEDGAKTTHITLTDAADMQDAPVVPSSNAGTSGLDLRL